MLTSLQKQMEELTTLDEVSAMRLRLSLLELMNHVIEKAAATDNRSPEAVKLNQDLQTIYIELRENGVKANLSVLKPKILNVLERLKYSSAFTA